MRRWISDGVWQRFNAQFAMMRRLGQRNVVSELKVRKVFIDAIEEDGSYDLAHVGIHFTAHDDFVCAKYPQLDQRGPLELIEYWTFIRKAGADARRGDLYRSNLCPSCGSELPDNLGEVAQVATGRGPHVRNGTRAA